MSFCHAPLTWPGACLTFAPALTCPALILLKVLHMHAQNGSPVVPFLYFLLGHVMHSGLNPMVTTPNTCISRLRLRLFPSK